MIGFLIRALITALGLALASWLVPGLSIEGGWTLLLAAVLLGVVNAFVRPVVVLLTLPLTLLTLGLFLLVINGGMLLLVAAFLDGFRVAGLISAVFGSIIISITSWIAASYIGPNGRVEIIVVRR